MELTYLYVLIGLCIAWQTMGTILVILVGLHLSRRLNDHYYDREDTEETFRAMVSKVWEYTEAVDDSATGGAGNTLYLERLSSRKTKPRQPA